MAPCQTFLATASSLRVSTGVFGAHFFTEPIVATANLWHAGAAAFCQRVSRSFPTAGLLATAQLFHAAQAPSGNSACSASVSLLT